MKTLPLVAAIALICSAPAFAQSSHGSHTMPPAPSPASAEYMKSMTGMDKAMRGMKMTGDPSKDFVLMMKPHHQAAVEMAQTYLKYGKDPMLTKMANDIIKSQNEEIGAMDDWLKKNGGK